MNKSKRSVINFVVCALLLAIIGDARSAPPLTPGPAVTVMNSAQNPVPVVQQGTVAITANSPLPVTLSATESQPVRLSLRYIGDSAGDINKTRWQVPAQKRFHITHISVEGFKLAQCSLGYGGNNLFVVPVGDSNSHKYIGNFPVDLNAGPGEQVRLWLTVLDRDLSSAVMYVSGYLVDAPAEPILDVEGS